MCERGHPKDDHGCRLNFEGSAKAIDPQGAINLIAKNPILNECNIKVGVMIGDNDSTAIYAARNVSTHDIIKQSDTNHTSKGLTNKLYKIKKNIYKELNTTTINYLQKCFNYSIVQNKGDCENMSKAIRNIPYHCFNKHQNCGAWCTFSKNPENYEHSNIGDRFQDPDLFKEFRVSF